MGDAIPETMAVAMSGLAHRGRRAALVDARRSISYEQLAEEARRLSSGLAGLGLTPGDRVVLVLGNNIDLVLCYLACALSGYVAVPVSRKSGVDGLAGLAKGAGVAAAIVAEERREEAADLRHGVLEDVEHWITDRASSAGPDLAGVIASGSTSLPFPCPRPDDVYCAMFTGGTTGQPKLALQTQQAWATTVASVAVRWSLGPGDRHLMVLPMTSVAWFSVAAHLFVGATTWLQPEWDPQQARNAVLEERITVLNMIPTMLGDLLEVVEADDDDLSSVRQLTVAGSPMPEAMYRRAVGVLGDRLGAIYGLTETAGPVTFLNPEEMSRDRVRSGGRPGPDVAIAILDESRRPIGTNGTGEIALKGPQVTPGYLDQPEENTSAFTGGWFLTGDVGHVDVDGFVHILDRSKEMIKTGGLNVYPREVEEVLYSHPAVLEAVVIGLPDPRWVEAVTGVVVIEQDSGTSSRDLVIHCRDRLPGHKVPKAIHVLPALPRTTIGKFDRARLARDLRDRVE